MANYRVYEAAEELGVDSKQLIQMLHQMDVRVRSHMSTVTDVQIARLRARLERERRGTPDEGEAESTGGIDPDVVCARTGEIHRTIRCSKITGDAFSGVLQRN